MEKGTWCILPNGHEGIIAHVDGDVENGVIYYNVGEEDVVWVEDITSVEPPDNPGNQTGWWESEHLRRV